MRDIKNSGEHDKKARSVRRPFQWRSAPGSTTKVEDSSEIFFNFIACRLPGKFIKMY